MQKRHHDSSVVQGRDKSTKTLLHHLVNA